MTWFSVDVEADGPIPGVYSMPNFGAVVVNDHSKTFAGFCKPISELWIPEALAVSGFTREETLAFPDPKTTMMAFVNWIKQFPAPYIMAADNNGFDWQFINYYMHVYTGSNPFGFSSRNINDIYHGLKSNAKASFKHLRQTKHDHDPVNDAKGNAEALIYMRDHMGYKVNY